MTNLRSPGGAFNERPIKLSESTNTLRRLYFTLIDAGDFVSGAVVSTSGVKGLLSKNGTISGNTTNDITAVDTTNQPGEYYIELTATECDTLGQVIVYINPNGCVGTRVRAPIVSFAPYAVADVNTFVDGVLDKADTVETGLTLRQALRLMSAVLFGKSTGMNTSTNIFRSAITDVKARVTATSDTDGNRLLVTVDGT